MEPETRALKGRKCGGLPRLLFLIALILAATAVAAAVAAVVIRHEGILRGRPRPSQAISRVCGRARYPSLCVNSLIEFPGAMAADDKDLVPMSVNMTLQRAGHALNFAYKTSMLEMDTQVRSAHEDCVELLEDSVDLLSRALNSVDPDGDDSAAGTTDDVLTWMSAAMTNHDTCSEGFDQLTGHLKRKITQRLRDLSDLSTNSLAIYASGLADVSTVPIQNRRRRLLTEDSEIDQFPSWLPRRERMLLQIPASKINADAVVSLDGNGTCTTIKAAIKLAPEKSNRRFIIYVRAGRYEEDNLRIGRKKTNIMLIGEGKGVTVISGGKSVQDGVTTFHTASFAATGEGFIARDITFLNWAGPAKHQAVALRVGADYAVIYRCSIEGFQDTLYVHSKRQFYRECDIYGTVDFIFGNAAVVFQKCNIYARKPLEEQKNTITAQNRKDPSQNTGISIHDCRIIAQPDLEEAKGTFPTYLGRPWKLYSRTVYMLSYLGDHIHPNGWLAWNGDFALDTLYYGEYMNYGPGSSLSQRITWPGYRNITSGAEASRFTVENLIQGSSWLPSTGVAFEAGLST